jgi:hypothetical protein
LATSQARLAALATGYVPGVIALLQRIRELFNRGSDREPILSNETPEQHFADLPQAEQERNLDKSLLPPDR